MAKMTSYAGSLVIASGQTTSNTLVIGNGRMSTAITIVGPAALTGTVGLQVAFGGETPQAVATDGGSALTVVAATTKRFNVGGAAAVRMVSSGAEGAERTATVYVEHELN